MCDTEHARLAPQLRVPALVTAQRPAFVVSANDKRRNDVKIACEIKVSLQPIRKALKLAVRRLITHEFGYNLICISRCNVFGDRTVSRVRFDVLHFGWLSFLS